jgi:exopolysaccharide biosynthesis polyprenyl glycosylphosphotransferase
MTGSTGSVERTPMAQGRSHIRSLTLWIATMDLVCLLLGSGIGVMVRFGHEEMTEYVFNHLEGWLLLFGGVILANYLAGGYKLQYTFSRFNLIVTWVFSIAFALMILSVTSYAWVTAMLGRGVLLLSLSSYSVLSLFLKLLVYRSLFRSEIFQCRTVILGVGERVRELKRMLEGEFVLPAHRVVACIRVVDPRTEPVHNQAAVIDNVAVIDAPTDMLESVIRSLGVRLIVLAMEDPRGDAHCYPALKRLRFDGVEVLNPLNVAEIYSGRTPLDLINEEYLMQASLESELPVYRRIKSVIDIVISVFAIILLSPLALVIITLTKLTSPLSPVFYSQIRVGRFGKEFRIHKFRTMRHGAEARTGAVWAAERDPRITRLGFVLRRFRLDEVPQLINILKGEMSIVGPRPERPELTEQLAKRIPFYDERENVTPGLTGWAQIRYPYGSTVEDAAHKLEYDLYYMKHLSFSLDLQIILMTLRIVVLGKEREH